ncbi:hypothetical protein BJV82DRAFT_608418 [Fennellomyces sp. T-0311]|nr:hypothetical protein BJV82DRAFT_608418 [Fennellomyces sp. T-0311]
MDAGMIVFWVFFSIIAAVIAIGWLAFLLPAAVSILETLCSCFQIPRCLYLFTPEEFKIDSKKSYGEYGRYEARYICVCDRSVWLYQVWHLKNRIVNKMRSQIGCTKPSSLRQSADLLPMSQPSAPRDEPSTSASSVPKNPYTTVTMGHGIDWASSSSQTESKATAQQ